MRMFCPATDPPHEFKVPFHPSHDDLICDEHQIALRTAGQLKSRKPLQRASKKKEGRGSTLRRTQPKRDWSDARAKVEEEGCCRVCGSGTNVEAAHITGRKHDEPLLGSQTLYVHPNRIVPLCGDYIGDEWRHGCHGRYDAHELDLLSYLTTAEQAQAVQDAGSIESARARLCPSAYREAVA
jgi:hypothetical protein